jgi:hypothetical protein
MTRVEDMSRVVWDGSSCWGFFLSGFGFGVALFEAEAIIAGLDDMAMVGKRLPLLRSALLGALTTRFWLANSH